MNEMKTTNTKATNWKTAKTRTPAKSAHAKANAESTWKQFEDHLVPQLRLSVIERAVYSHLLRHSRLEGKRDVRFSIKELACRGKSARSPPLAPHPAQARSASDSSSSKPIS